MDLRSVTAMLRSFIDRLWSPRMLPWLAASLGIVATCWGYSLASSEERNQQQARFERLVDDTKWAINSRIERLKALVEGSGSLFAASDVVNRDEWRRHVDALNLRKNHPGVQALSYVSLVSAQELPDFVAATQDEMGPRFIVHPSGDRDEYRILEMVEPAGENNVALGLDVNTRAACQEAMDRACDSGEIALTGRYRLHQDIGDQYALIMYFPVYRNGLSTSTVLERRAAIEGWVSAAIKVDTLLGSLPFLRDRRLMLTLYDGTNRSAANKLFDNNLLSSEAATNEAPRDDDIGPTFKSQTLFTRGGRTWTLDFSSSPGFIQNSSNPERVAIAGLVLSLLLFRIVSTSTNMQAKALQLAAKMTESLRQTEVHTRILGLVVSRSENAVIVTDRHGCIEWVNEGFTRLTQYTLAEVMGQKPSSLLEGPDTDPAIVKHMLRQLEQGLGFQTELLYYAKSKQSYWAAVEVQPICDEQGQLTNFMAIQRDITERKAADQALLEKERLLRRRHDALSSLARHEGLFDGEHRRALQIIAEKASEALDVDRISVWLFDSGRRTLFCQNLFGRSSFEHSQGSMLRAAEFPNYFLAVSNNEVIAADDAHADPRTCEFSETYLSPLKITSMLDVPIRSSGRLIGVLCHEHIGPARKWTLEEQNFAAAMSSLISLVMEAGTRRSAEKSLAQQAEALRHQEEQIEEARVQAALSNGDTNKLLAIGSVDLAKSASSIADAAPLPAPVGTVDGGSDADRPSSFARLHAEGIGIH